MIDLPIDYIWTLRTVDSCNSYGTCRPTCRSLRSSSSAPPALSQFNGILWLVRISWRRGWPSRTRAEGAKVPKISGTSAAIMHLAATVHVSRRNIHSALAGDGHRTSLWYRGSPIAMGLRQIILGEGEGYDYGWVFFALVPFPMRHREKHQHQMVR